MTPIPAQSLTAEPPQSQINLQWLIRLRFFSLAGQLATILAVEVGMHIALPLSALLGLLLLNLLSNVGALIFMRRGHRIPPSMLVGLMIYDVVHLTALLYLTGGPYNPFSFAYLVLIALATLVLSERQVWGLAAIAVSGSALLFLHHRPLILPGGHADHMRTHLYGMWVAFSVAAGFIVYFMVRIRRALNAREAALWKAEQAAAQRDKLASLATLAAGAAHELATPLSTISLVAAELTRQLNTCSDSVRSDLDLIRSEVLRCRAVLDQMAADAGQSVGEQLVPMSMAALAKQICAGLASEPAIAVQVATPDQTLLVPVRALTQALRGLVKNGQDASPKDRSVHLSLSCVADVLQIEVTDRGSGIPAAIASRVGEPFFSTKSPGQGMGLGVFLCRTVLESLGGALQLSAAQSGGTCARATIPLAGPATICRSLPDASACNSAA